MHTNPSNALSVARRYHDDWVAGRYGDAINHLDEQVVIEVPINEYSTRASFAQALASFGSMVSKVALLSSLAGDDEAMLLYDLSVRGIGLLRVAEHFTIRAGRIVQLRQIHDTAPIRTAGLGK